MENEIKGVTEFSGSLQSIYEPFDSPYEPSSRRLKRGVGARPLLESEIKEAQRNSRSAAEAARNLGVCFNTYKKYAKLYGIFDNLLNPRGIGIVKGGTIKGESRSLDAILNNEHPNYPAWKLKQRLISHGYMEEKCANCGFNEKRILDFRVPLVLDFMDGDRKNYSFDNLRFLCFNCSYLINGNLMGPRKLYEF
jgi:hypothetical protein